MNLIESDSPRASGEAVGAGGHECTSAIARAAGDGGRTRAYQLTLLANHVVIGITKDWSVALVQEATDHE
jgi:hypothetical protein